MSKGQIHEAKLNFAILEKIAMETIYSDIDMHLLWIIKSKIFLLLGNYQQALDAINESIKMVQALSRTTYTANIYILIPLYSVAIAWLQILCVVAVIPFLSGVFKTPTNFLFQNLIVFVSSLSFNFYLVWSIGFDTDIKVFQQGERRWLSILLALLVSFVGLVISFIPTESFLRALFLATLFLFNFSYIQAHFKNKLSMRLLLENGVISIVFFVILLLFRT